MVGHHAPLQILQWQRGTAQRRRPYENGFYKSRNNELLTQSFCSTIWDKMDRLGKNTTRRHPLQDNLMSEAKREM